jgi:mannose-6-phosphate isomerase-like protein (cupin superfamily)
MPIIRPEDVPEETFANGATYHTLVGDDAGSTPVRVGVQTSPPGYSTGVHQHPYMEIVTVLEGEGEAWIDGEGDPKPIGPGSTLILPADTAHSFTNTGSVPLRTYGVHASPERVVKREG